MSHVFSNRIVIGIVAMALFMESVDSTILNTAIPVMAVSLHVNPINLKIALISYLLSLAVFIPISGWISDKYGSKSVFISAVTLFSLSSLWCGFSENVTYLILGRVFQGMGGAMMLPVARLILIRAVERSKLISVMSAVVMIASLGLMLGPVLGGIITHFLSWRWIFWVNIPIGFLTILFGIYGLRDNVRHSVRRLDKVGFVVFGSGLVLLTLGLSTLSELSIPDRDSLVMLCLSILFFLTYGWHSRDKAHPIVNMDLFKERTFKVSVAGNLLGRLGFGGVPFLLPLLLQIGLGYSALLSGALLAPMALGVFFVKIFTRRLLRYFGYKKLLIYNTLCLALSLWSFMLVSQEASVFRIGILTFFFGVLISFQYGGMNSLAYANIEEKNLSSATSIMSTLQQVAQSFGVAVSALFIRFFSPTFDAHWVLTVPVFHQTFFAMGLVTLLSLLVFIKLRAEDGANMLRESKAKIKDK